MSDIIKWKNPPAPRKGRRPSRAVDAMVEKLKRHPGRWALVIEGANTGGAGAVFTRRGCEVRSVVQRSGDDRRDFYARWPEASK